MEAKMPPPQVYVERTLAVVKPDAMDKASEIENIILRNGFLILQVRCTLFSGFCCVLLLVFSISLKLCFLLLFCCGACLVSC